MANKAIQENFISNWNADVPDYKLSVDDLKKPQFLMGALFKMFERLGIDREAVLKPPGEQDLNDHIVYYWDMLPVINMTRVLNHLYSVMPQFPPINVNYFLQPTAQTSQSLLLLLFNYMLFNEQRLQSIAPKEEELFHFNDVVREMEQKKNDLLEMLNRQAEEKGKRSNRMEQMKNECQQLEEELEKEMHRLDSERQELQPMLKEINMADLLVDQKRATKEGLLAERERKKAMRVYDADDIRAQAAQATQNVQEAEEKLNSLQAIITQKENSLKILQMIKPNLDTANNFLHEITKLKDYEMSDLDEDSKEGELEVLNTDIMELQAQEAELNARRADVTKKRTEGNAKRHQERTLAENKLREAEDKDKKRREFISKAVQRSTEIKHLTAQYEEEKTAGFDSVKQMKEDFNSSVKAWEDALVKIVTEIEEKINNKLKED